MTPHPTSKIISRRTVDEASATIVQAMIGLESRGICEDAIALGALHASIDLIGSGVDVQRLIPPEVWRKLIGVRLAHLKIERIVY